MNENTINKFTFSRSGGFIEPLAATAAAIAASTESGSDSVSREEMDSPKSDNDEDMEIRFRKEQMDLNANELGVMEFGKEVDLEVPSLAFKCLRLT